MPLLLQEELLRLIAAQQRSLSVPNLKASRALGSLAGTLDEAFEAHGQLMAHESSEDLGVSA